MSLRLLLLRPFLPVVFAKRGLRELFVLTAAAFERTAPDLGRKNAAERLALYAETTARWAGEAPAAGGGEKIRGRLRREAFLFGLRMRRRLGVRTEAEAWAAARLLYGLIGIDFQAGPGGAMAMSRCAFAARYNSEVCGIMSGFDEGFLAGLWREGRMAFSARLTEGAPVCRAEFRFSPDSEEAP